MNNLQGQNSWPSDAHLFRMVPCGCGGRANLPGNVAYGDTWASENGPVPARNFESYGNIWGQEIAHNFGRYHAGNSHNEQPPPDLSFPYAHGSIGEPGLAISTEWWNGSPFLIAPGVPSPSGRYPHPHDFMSYGSVNDLAEHTFGWVSPYTYGALFQSFPGTSPDCHPRAIDKHGEGCYHRTCCGSPVRRLSYSEARREFLPSEESASISRGFALPAHGAAKLGVQRRLSPGRRAMRITPH